jgi:O-methyltransferase involved in polyketide biosynthesis
MKQERLSGVPETLLMTLYHRALETQRPDGIICDRPAVEIVKQIDYDFTRFDDWKIQWGVAVRTELFDNVVQSFLTEFCGEQSRHVFHDQPRWANFSNQVHKSDCRSVF